MLKSLALTALPARRFFLAALLLMGASSCGPKFFNENYFDQLTNNQDPVSAPAPSFVQITDISPTANDPLSLSYGPINGSYAEYCLLENNTNSNSCVWVLGALPTVFSPVTNEGNVVLSTWLRTSDGTVSTRVDSNTVYADRVAPAIASFSITNSNPTNQTNYALTYGAVTGTYAQYCILENNTSPAGCSWNSGSLPGVMTVTSTQNAKTLSLWLRDSAGNVSVRRDTGAVTLDTTNPTVTLTSHTGGGTIGGGANSTITWTGSDANPGSTPIRIEHSSNSGSTWSVLSATEANDGSYTWSVPAVTSTTNRIRLTFTDAAGNTATSSSTSDFTINSSSPLVAVTSPNGGEFWGGNTAHDITWTSSGLPGGASNAKLEYTTNNGTTWTTIATGETNDGLYSWTTPAATNSAQVRVRVTVTDSLAVDTADESNANFTIDSTAPSVTLASLTGGQMIAGGANTTITWTASDNFSEPANPILIEVSSNSGGTWSTLASAEANDGSYTWAVPAVTSTTYRVRVSMTDRVGLSNTSASTSDFTINSSTPVVTVTSPNGAESWKTGDTRSITWTSSGLPPGPSTVTIAYSLNGGVSYGSVIVSGDANDGSYDWTVPSVGPGGVGNNDTRIRVTVTDALAVNTADSSDSDFKIDNQAPTITLTSLTGGQQITGGVNTNITWTPATDSHDGGGFGSGPISLHYSLDSGATWTLIASGETNDGSYTWTAPSVTLKTARVRVTATDAAGWSGSSASSSDFWINASTPTLTLTSPNGGEYLKGGSNSNITWTTSGLPAGAATIALEYSTDSGSTWTSIATGETDDGTYSWNVPGWDDSEVRVRATVTDAYNVQTSDISNADLTIDSALPALTLTSLTGGQIITGGTNNNINWTGSDTNAGTTPISIEYSSDSGSTWSSIATSLSNSGSYAWATPAVTGTTYRVRVTFTDLAGNVRTRTSTSDFSINSTTPVVAVTAPNGGEFISGLGTATSNITWNASGLPAGASTATLEYSQDSGSTWTTIASGIANSSGANTYAWDPPSLDDSDMRVRVTVTDFFSVQTADNSNANFTLDSASPTISILSPNGGEVWGGNTAYDITWTASDMNLDTTPVWIQASSNSGVSMSNIATYQANDGVYSWTTPSVDSSTYKIRVLIADRAGNISYATSATDFTISTTPPSLASATITNSSPTNTTTYGLSYGAVTGTYTHYCILENDTTVGNCTWTAGTLPASKTVGATENAKVLSIWIRNAANIVSTRVDTNSVTLDTTAPQIASFSTTNTDPTGYRNFVLEYGAQTGGTYSQYCIREDTTVGSCSWTTGTLPYSYTVSAGNGAKQLTVWIRDAAGNISTARSTTSITYSNTVTLTASATTASNATGSRIISGNRMIPAKLTLDDGNVYLFGGVINASYNTTELVSAYQPASDTWKSKAPMHSSRSSFQPIKLSSGKVVVAGGLNWPRGGGSAGLNTVEIYDPSTDQWSARATMSTARYRYAAVKITHPIDGTDRIIYFGGKSDGTTTLSTVIQYNPANDSWKTLTSMSTARSDHTATLLTDGRILIAGGQDGGTAVQSSQIYNPATNTWSGTTAMQSVHAFHTAIHFSNTENSGNGERVFVLGSGGSGIAYNDALEYYDVSANTWTSRTTPGSVTETGEYPQLVKVDYGSGYRFVLIGATTSSGNHSAVISEYNPFTNVWSDTGHIAATTNYRGRHIAELLSNGKILVAGGSTSGWNETPGYNFLHNPATQTTAWSKPFYLRVRNPALVTLSGSMGATLQCGGYDTFMGSVIPYCFKFDPETGAWDSVASMSVGRQRFTLNLEGGGSPNKVVAIGGMTSAGFGGGATVTNTTEVYNISADTWTTSGNLTNGRTEHATAITPLGEILISGGNNGNATYYTNAEKFSFANNLITAAGTMASARIYHRLFYFNNGAWANRIVTVGGFNGSTTPLTSEYYDWATNTWTTFGGNTVASHSGYNGFVGYDGVGDRLTIFTGISSNGGSSTNVTEHFATQTGSWANSTATDDLPTTYGRYGSGFAWTGCNTYLLLGGTEGTAAAGYFGNPVYTVYKYVAGWETFTATTNLQMRGEQQHHMRAATVNMSQVILGGVSGTGSTNIDSSELYHMAVPISVTASGGDGNYTLTKTSGLGTFYPKQRLFVPHHNDFSAFCGSGGTTNLSATDGEGTQGSRTITTP